MHVALQIWVWMACTQILSLPPSLQSNSIKSPCHDVLCDDLTYLACTYCCRVHAHRLFLIRTRYRVRDVSEEVLQHHLLLLSLGQKHCAGAKSRIDFLTLQPMYDMLYICPCLMFLNCALLTPVVGMYLGMMTCYTHMYRKFLMV